MVILHDVNDDRESSRLISGENQERQRSYQGSATWLLNDEGTTSRCMQINCFKICFILFYAVICPLHLFCLGIRSIFDAVCLVKDSVSLVNCSQEVVLNNPQPLVILMHLTTVMNTVMMLVTLHLKPAGIEFCGFGPAMQMLAKKGCFWSFNITFIFVVAQKVMVAYKVGNVVNTAVVITDILFIASRLIVAYFVNYLHPVKFPSANERNCERICTWLAYWITLVLFFLDCSHLVLAVTLNVAEKVTPFGRVIPGSHDFGAVAHLVLIGIEATFELRLFAFYWNKIFHGNKDLFSSIAILRPIQATPYTNIHRSNNGSYYRGEP